MDDASLLSVTADATLAQLRRAYVNRLADWVSSWSARGGSLQPNESAGPESIRDAYVRLRDRALQREESLHALATASPDVSESDENGRAAVFEALERRDVGRAEQLLDTLYARGQLRWDRLRDESDPERLETLFVQFGERELLSGRGSELASLLASAKFSEDVSRVPGLLPHAHRLATFTVVDNSEETSRFIAAHPNPAQPVTNWPRVHRTIASWSKACEALGLSHGDFSAIWLSPLLVEPSPEIEDVILRFFADGHAAVARLDALRARAKPLLGHVMHAAQFWAPRDDRTWYELTAEEQEELRALANEMERVAARDPYRRLLHYLPHMGLVLVLCASTMLGLVYGVVALLAAFVAIPITWTKGAAFVYRRALRPLLAPHVTGKGMPPDRVIEAACHISHESRRKHKIAEDYVANFIYDDVLATVAALRRLDKARGQGAIAKRRLASLHLPPSPRE